MALKPSDCSLAAAQPQHARAAFDVWDARDLLAAYQRFAEEAIIRVLDVVCAPRRVVLPSAAHAAKFLLEMVWRSSAPD